MTNLVRFSEAVSLGLHAMAILARERGRRRTGHEMAETLGASVHHLAKVMQRLVRARLVDSSVGPRGGFRLARPAGQIKLLEIYEAAEGPLADSGCLLNAPVCNGKGCMLGELVQKVEREVRTYLKKTTLAKLAGNMALVKTPNSGNAG